MLSVLIRKSGCREAFERHSEGNVLGDPAAQVEVQRLLLQRPVHRGLGSQPTGDLDAAIERSLVGHDLTHHAPLERRLCIDVFARPQQPLRARRAHDLLPHDVEPVATGDPERRVGQGRHR